MLLTHGLFSDNQTIKLHLNHTKEASPLQQWPWLHGACLDAAEGWDLQSCAKCIVGLNKVAHAFLLMEEAACSGIQWNSPRRATSVTVFSHCPSLLLHGRNLPPWDFKSFLNTQKLKRGSIGIFF